MEDNGCFYKQLENQKIALESYFEERAQETWERNLKKTTLLKTCNPILMEAILKKLREHFTDDDQRKAAAEIAGFVPETSLEWRNNLEKNEEDSGDVNDGYLPEDLVLIASPDSCKGSWHNQSPMLRSSQRRLMKQE